MLGASLLNQTHELLILQQHNRNAPDIDFVLGEQECVSQMKKCRNMEEFKQFHGRVIKIGMMLSPFCASNLVASCAIAEWGSMDYACSIFRQIDDPCSFDFNVMIRGYARDMESEAAIFTYLEMLEFGVEPENFTFPPLLKACSQLSAAKEGMQIHGQVLKLGFVEDLFVQSSLINFYGKCGLISHSCRVFDQMDTRTVASWSSLIAAYAYISLWNDCFRIFRDMNRTTGIRVEESTLVSVLSACSHLGALDYGRAIHGYIVRNLSESNVAVITSLIDMYINCGNLKKAMLLFQEMDNKNQKSYSVVISGLTAHGQWEEALRVFSEMEDEGLKPDDITYVGVLSSCSNGGLVEKGMEHFERMKVEHGIKPTIQHYGCMVELLGRAGLLEAAIDFIRSMPVESNDVVWRSLLSSCKTHRNVEVGEIAANNLYKLSFNNAGDHLVLCNMYAQAERWQDVAKMRMEMFRLGLRQEPGSSFIVVKRKVHRFMSNDRSHPQSRAIYEMLHQMEWQLRFEGYCADTSQVLFDVDEHEKKQRLRSHSQKLALAFSLMETAEGTPIRITRNVRMCRDCHNYTKLISLIYQREITVRDRNTYHCFRQGTCSCSH